MTSPHRSRGRAHRAGRGCLVLAASLLAAPAGAAAAGSPARAVRPANAAAASCRIPDGGSPPVPRALAEPSGPRASSPLSGFALIAGEPKLSDRRRRMPATRIPRDFGETLRPGEGFRFDVTFAGNPAGLAEAHIVAVEPDVRGPPPAGAPIVRIEGHARTSGVVSLLSTLTDDIVSIVDAATGAPVTSTNIIERSGLGSGSYRRRVTSTAHEGHGHLRIVDDKDGKIRKLVRVVPFDTFDPMSAMAWVRSLDLRPGERARAHAMDGTVLLRIEVVSRGAREVPSMPGIGTALGITSRDVELLEGSIMRVDRYDDPIPGKRHYALRAWLSSDSRRIPLVLESDMWVGSIRLELTHYDPPAEEALAGPRPTAGAR